jgi:uncharacterized protein YbjT (DUF2867 family)
MSTGRSVVILGASGLVGSHCLTHLLAHDHVAKVTAFVRRPLGVTHQKLQERPLGDVDPRGAAWQMPKDVDDAHCAIGTTMKVAGSRDAFVRVDKDTVLAFAQAARAAGARRFVLVSSTGADARSMNFYLRVKGEVERAVGDMGFDVVHILRPSVLDGPRAEHRPGEKAAVVVMNGVARVLGKRFKYAPIHVDTVGRAMVKLAFSDVRGVTTHESPALQGFANAPI